MTLSLLGQTIFDSFQNSFQALPLSDVVNSVLGHTATVIYRPDDTTNLNYNLLVLKADKGSFRLRIGVQDSSMPAAVMPTGSVTDGSAGWLLSEGNVLILPNPQAVTIVGYADTDVLTYQWV